MESCLIGTDSCHIFLYLRSVVLTSILNFAFIVCLHDVNYQIEKSDFFYDNTILIGVLHFCILQIYRKFFCIFHILCPLSSILYVLTHHYIHQSLVLLFKYILTYIKYKIAVNLNNVKLKQVYTV